MLQVLGFLDVIKSYVTPDGLNFHVGGYCGTGKLTPPPPQEGAGAPPAALMYILCDVPVHGAHQAPNADLLLPQVLRPLPHEFTPGWLVTTDEQCAQAAEQAPLWNDWVVL